MAHELKDILAKELLTELGDMQRAQLVLPALYNELVSLEKRKQQLRDSMQLKIEQCKCDLRRGVIDEYARVESEIRIWVHEYQPRTRIRFMSMDSVKEMSIEVVEHVRLKIRERFNGWYKDVFTPLINKYCDEIIISNGKELNDIVTEIFRVQEQLPVVNADNTDKQVASLADSIGFRDSIPYPFMLDSLKELEQRISLNLSSFGIICDPFPFPFAPLMELLLKVCLTSGNNLIRNMKDAISQGVIRKLHEDAPVKADDIANKAVGEFMEYVDDVMSAIDIEIEKARIQVTGINEVNWDKEYLSCHKQLIVRIEKRVQDIYIELDNMMFELLEA